MADKKSILPVLPLSFHPPVSSWNRMPGKQELGREGMGRERWHVGESGGRWVNDGIHSLSAAFPSVTSLLSLSFPISFSVHSFPLLRLSNLRELECGQEKEKRFNRQVLRPGF